MSGDYARDMMKVAIAKMLQTIGWNSTHPSSLNVLTDLAIQYTTQIATLSNKYANEFGCTDPNLDHVGLAFADNHVNLSELEEYVSKVNWNQAPTPVPKFPIPQKDNLNFLKPGSTEVITRPLHIYEHLPPMYQFNDNEDKKSETDKREGLKRPAEAASGQLCKRRKLVAEEDGTPTRELSSVMMTTSGFISPAREGKLPSNSIVAELKNAPIRYFNFNSEKILKQKAKKKELFKGIPKQMDEAKLNQRKPANIIERPFASVNNKFDINKEVKVAPTILSTLLAAKTIKSNTQTIEKPASIVAPFKNVDKLFAESDKKKVNVLKKLTTYFHDDSLPGLHEIITQNPPVVVNKEERNRKDKSKIKKVQNISSPFSDLRCVDTKLLKTPEALLNTIKSSPSPMVPQFNLFPQFAGSDLIPEPLTNPLNSLYNSKNYFGKANQPVPPYNPYVPPILKIDVPKVKPDNTSTKLTCRTPSPLTSSSSAPMDPPLLSLGMEKKIKEHEKDKLKKKHKKDKTETKLKEEKKHKLNSLYNFKNYFGKANQPVPPYNPYVPPILKIDVPKVKPDNTSTKLTCRTPSPLTSSSSAPMDPPLLSLGMEKKIKEHEKDKLKKKHKKDKTETKLKEEKKHKLNSLYNFKNYFGKANQPVPPYNPYVPPILKIDVPKVKPDNTSTKLTCRTPSPLTSSSSAPMDPLLLSLGMEKKIKEREKDKLKKKHKKDKTEKRLKEEKKHKLMKESKEKRNEEPPRSLVRENLEISISKRSTPSPRTDDSKKMNSKSLNIKEEEKKSKIFPELAKISAYLAGQPKPKPNSPDLYSEGDKIWICPACGKQDDGTPMIGCDDCDGWYHWVCVGIKVPPDDDEDWYCKSCIIKKVDVSLSDNKKKKRKH